MGLGRATFNSLAATLQSTSDQKFKESLAQAKSHFPILLKGKP